MSLRENIRKFDGFSYSRGELHCEGVSLQQIADEAGTPFYVYSRAAIANRVRRLTSVFENADFDCSIYFAVKACSNIHVLRVLQTLGCGADIVSGGELFRASIAEIDPGLVVYSGVGKTDREIAEAIDAGIFMFNVESVPELGAINSVAGQRGRRAAISLRFNPDVDAKTHPHISTGLKKNKFGLAKTELAEAYKHLREFRHLDFRGLSIHIGSQVVSAQPFLKSWNELLAAAAKAPFKVEHLNLGGGLGISYSNEKELSLEDYARLIQKTFEHSGYRIGIEPGRALVGPAGALVTKLSLVKKRGAHLFYVVDAGMNDLIRPALYGATHPVVPVVEPSSKKQITADLVGPVCESADTFQFGARMPEIAPNALLAFGNAGAYGMSMASQYNSRARPAEILVEGGSYQIIGKRETYADLIRREL